MHIKYCNTGMFEGAGGHHWQGAIASLCLLLTSGCLQLATVQSSGSCPNATPCPAGQFRAGPCGGGTAARSRRAPPAPTSPEVAPRIAPHAPPTRTAPRAPRRLRSAGARRAILTRTPRHGAFLAGHAARRVARASTAAPSVVPSRTSTAATSSAPPAQRTRRSSRGSRGAVPISA